GIGFFGGGERLAGEEIAAGKVCERERIAIASVGEHELALVVGAPQVIGLHWLGVRGSLRPVAPSRCALDQAVAIENRMHRADRRCVHIRVSRASLSLIFGAPQLGLSCLSRTICVSTCK